MTERESHSYFGADLQLKRPEWVRIWRTVHIGWLVAFSVLTAGFVALAVLTIRRSDSMPSGTLIGVAWLAFVVFGTMALAVVLSGLGSARLSRFVRPVDVAAVGRGLSVPGRGDVLIRSLIFAAAILAGASYILWKDDEPGRRQMRAEIAALIGAPAFLLYFILGFVIVNRTRISLHPDGIVQEIFRRRAWKVDSDITVVPWDEIIDLQPHGHPNPAMSHPHWYPTIRVVHRGEGIESDQVLVLLACEKKVEPNALLALLQWCRGNRRAREQLSHDDARELLRPPSLLERIRADRASATSGGRSAFR